jgi:hypothetical protein
MEEDIMEKKRWTIEAELELFRLEKDLATVSVQIGFSLFRETMEEATFDAIEHLKKLKDANCIVRYTLWQIARAVEEDEDE